MVYLQITLNINLENRSDAAAIYQKFKGPFLESIKGAKEKKLLIRDDDIQVLHAFDALDDAQAYLNSDLFNSDVVAGLAPLLNTTPDIRIYTIV